MVLDNERAKARLIPILKARRALLLAGAGSSMFVGYPGWGQLIEQMRAEFAPDFAWTNTSPISFATTIVGEIEKMNRMTDYYNFLDRTFGPHSDRTKQHDDFHVALVQLGFCGLVTTNYEEVIESAVTEAYTTELRPWRCAALDLCLPRSYRVFDFFQALAQRENPEWVLHLHGHFLNPKSIILTERDYQRSYGESPTYDAQERPLNVKLDTLHRKVLWALFATHPLVFVGFSLRDDFFVHMLRVVREDFELGSDLTHFAFVGVTNDDDEVKAREYLRQCNTMPIFYRVPEQIEGEVQDHSDLKRLVYEIATDTGKPIVSRSLSSINKRMLEL